MSTEIPLEDADARDLIATALDETLVVEAAAGTGKTTELVRRIVRVLAAGRSTVDTLVAVTFTEKAAGELKLRLRQELEDALRAQPFDAGSRDRLEHALCNLEEAQVSTIHGFCAELLRERPVEAGIDPLFTVLTESQARRLFEEAFATWFHRTLADMPEALRRALRRSSRSTAGELDDDGPVARLRSAAWELTEWRDFEAAWTRPVFTRASTIHSLAQRVHEVAALTAAPGSARDVLHLDTAAVRRASDDLRLMAENGDDDAAEALLVDLACDRDLRRARKGSGSAFAKGVPRADVYASVQALLAELDGFRATADADLAALLREELRACIAEYQALKTRHGALDFLDLLLHARALIRDRSDVREAFQRRWTSICVDEFQDTDPLQAEILLLLAADDVSESDWTRVRPVPGKLFIVGDPKQSIYRFRRADVAIYQSVCDQLTDGGARRLFLRTSFRSVPAIQQAVNAAFGAAMTGDRHTLQAAYVPLSSSRAAIPNQPAVVALPVPEPYGKRQVSAAAIERSLPDAVGAYVDWILRQSGWKVSERRLGGVLVPVEARHICLLFRRFVNFGTDVTRAYVDALEARGIKHLLVGGRAFHDREEIESLRAALAAIEWPDDELSVFATLRGPLFAIGDEELLEYRHHHARAFHPFRIPETLLPAHLQPIADALSLLAELHQQRNRRPVADTINQLFESTRAHVALALRRAGEQVLANALHVSELARQYEMSGGISFRGFVEALRDAATTGQATEAPIVEEGSDGVRLMTVHKAKGLEFPIVVLADITAKLAPFEAPRHLDAPRHLCALRIGGWTPHDLLLQQPIEQAREREEGIRVAYVAATRARDVLVVPAIGDEEYDAGWLSPLNRAIYPAVDARRSPTHDPWCPPFRRDSVLTRPDAATAWPRTVSPGTHLMGEATSPFAVVWWDPATLVLGVEPPFGLRREELISKDVPSTVVAEGEARFRTWRAARDAAVAAGATPSLVVRTVGEWIAADVTASEAGADVASVQIVSLAAATDRPSGKRFGTLVHAALAAVPLDTELGTIATIVSTQGRIVAASSEEVAAAVHVIATVLRHPLLEQARQAERVGRCYREMPLTLTREGVLVEGTVDLAFHTDDGIVVIDFKTDRAEAELLARYERQVQLYATAIALSAQRPVTAVLMKV